MSHYPAARRRPVTALFLALALLVALPLAPATAQTPLAPTPLAPEGETIYPTEATPLAIPEFRWTAVEGATRYRIQFANNEGFASPFEFTTENTSYTPLDATKFTDGAWYWRVKVDRPTALVSEYSATRSFVKQWAVDANKPALLEPGDPATLVFFEQATFSWEPVLGAASYRLQIAASEDGFGSPIYNIKTLAPVHQPKDKLANGTYFWRVIPQDAKDRAGRESEVRSFEVAYDEVPALIEPTHGSEPTFTPTFRWEAVRGAQYYTLEYSTDPTFNAGITRVPTRNTSYTPVKDLPNDVNFYWRVRAQSGDSVGPWSETRTFVKQWYLQPVLLTPTNNYQYVHNLLFSWTPVPGARRYKFEINCMNAFPPSSCGKTLYSANPFLRLTNIIPAAGEPYYWRVTPQDAELNDGKPSAVYSFVSRDTVEAPQLVSPLYYYPPNDYPAGTETNPAEDRTVAYPFFVWNRMVAGGTQVPGYRVQVSTDRLFGSVAWSVDTAHLWAAPTTENPFAPAPGTDYFWRVRALDGGGAEIGQWSDIWLARFDAALAMAPSPAGSRPDPLLPAHGAEFAETATLLQWRPVEGATAYQVQISADADLADTAVDATVPYPAYAPTEPLVYDGDSAASLPYGTWYWRVRAVTAGGTGPWSLYNDNEDPVPDSYHRFQIAAQSHWAPERFAGETDNRWQIASDPAGDMGDANYDLTALYAAQDLNRWYFGFPVTAGAENMAYLLYIDIDHADGSGGTNAPRPNNVTYDITATEAHLPEYVVHVPQNGGAFDPAQIGIYRWTGTGWAPPDSLAAMGGTLSHAEGYLEIGLPNTLIGMEERTSSAAVALVSVRASGGPAQDTVPSDPAVDWSTVQTAGSVTLTRFASVTEKMTPAAPPSFAIGEEVSWPTLPPFQWNLPIDIGTTYWFGAQVQAAVDPEFTKVVLDSTYRTSQAAAVGRVPYALGYGYDLAGDNTYYWRVRPIYDTRNTMKGAWSEPWALVREGFAPDEDELRTNPEPDDEEPDTTPVFATPEFTWDLVEGAKAYDLQVSTDPAFGTTALNLTNLPRNAYTPVVTLANGTYHWRVRITRQDDGKNKVTNDWTDPHPFTLALPAPENLRHEPTATSGAPTLCWDPLVAANDEGTPVLAAWKYRVQVSADDTFTTIYDNVDTEQACWTPTKGYHDNEAYWWRVAMIDGNGKVGAYSTPASFKKAYDVPTLVSPVGGAASEGTPTFVWRPVDGAAQYKVEVSLTAGFNAIYDSATTHNARWTPTKAYAGDTTYYWRVRMIDADRREGSAEFGTVIVDPTTPPENGVWLPMVSRG